MPRYKKLEGPENQLLAAGYKFMELMATVHGFEFIMVAGVDPRTGLCSCGNKDCPKPGKHPNSHISWLKNRARSRNTRKLFEKVVCFGYNIGLCCGLKSKVTNKFLAVVDVDQQNHELLNALISTKTMYYRTGGGGYHFYFFHTEPLANSVSTIAAKLDVRGLGGYVVTPPSNHVSGKSYGDFENFGAIKNIPDFILSKAKTAKQVYLQQASNNNIRIAYSQPKKTKAAKTNKDRKKVRRAQRRIKYLGRILHFPIKGASI